MNLKAYTEKLLVLPLHQLKEIKAKDDSEMMGRLSSLAEYYMKFSKKVRFLEIEVIKINKSCGKRYNNVKKLVEDCQKLAATIKSAQKHANDVLGRFQKNKRKMVFSNKVLNDKKFEIKDYEEEMKQKFAEIREKIKNAEATLALKKDSLLSMEQVLESKIACFNNDRKEHKTINLASNNIHANEEKLTKMEIKEKDLSKYIAELKVKSEGFKQAIMDIEESMHKCILNAENLPKILENETKNIKKLREKILTEDKSLKQMITNKAKSESHSKNLKMCYLAGSLRGELLELNKLIREMGNKKKQVKLQDEQIKQMKMQFDRQKNTYQIIEGKLADEKETTNKLAQKRDELFQTTNNKRNDVNNLKFNIDRLKEKNEKRLIEAQNSAIFESTASSSSSSDSEWSFPISSSFNRTTIPGLNDIIENSPNDNVVSSSNDILKTANKNSNKRRRY